MCSLKVKGLAVLLQLTRIHHLLCIRARSFGAIPEWEYTEFAGILFFWHLLWFRNEQNSIPSILLPIDWRNSSLFVIDRIVGNGVLLAIFVCLSGKLCTQTCSISLPYFLSHQLFCFQNSTKSVLLGIDILYVSYRNTNRRNSPKRMCP